MPVAMHVAFLTVLPWLRTSGRPIVDGTVEELAVDGGFRLHFARDGADAVPPDDDDGNGRPDTVDEVARALADARSTYEADGWRPLVEDDGVGGGSGGGGAIDVYLRGLPVYGYATPIPVDDGMSCHLQLDPANAVAGGVMRSVVFHELHHCVQFRYTAGASAWLYESGATWQQYSQVEDPVLDYASGFLWLEWLQGTDRALSATDGRREYAAFVFTKFWAERGGQDGDATARVQRLWEELAKPADDPPPGWAPPLDRAARAEWGVGLDELFLDHATWNAFACAADDGAHYDPDVIPCISDTTVPAEPFVEGERVVHDDAPFTAAYRVMPAGDGPLRVTCQGPGDSRLVARTADGAEAEHSDGDDVQVEVPPGGDALLVLAGTTDRPLSRTCVTAEPVAAATVQASRGCATTGAGSAWAALLAAASLRGRRRST
jgi:uncharacterized protein (TIGR03382 family)